MTAKSTQARRLQAINDIQIALYKDTDPWSAAESLFRRRRSVAETLDGYELDKLSRDLTGDAQRACRFFAALCIAYAEGYVDARTNATRQP